MIHILQRWVSGKARKASVSFGMLNKCVSPMGKRQLKLWFLRPIVNIPVLEQRQRAIESFMRAPDFAGRIQVLPKKSEYAQKGLEVHGL